MPFVGCFVTWGLRFLTGRRRLLRISIFYLWFLAGRRRLLRISIFHCWFLTGGGKLPRIMARAELLNVPPPGRSMGYHAYMYIDTTSAIDLGDNGGYPPWLLVMSKPKVPCITRCTNLVRLNGM